MLKAVEKKSTAGAGKELRAGEGEHIRINVMDWSWPLFLLFFIFNLFLDLFIEGGNLKQTVR